MSAMPKTLGKYEIRSVIGQGAMGVVYEAFDPDIQRTVAIKVLHEHLTNTEEGQSFKERFRREAQAAAKCFHSNIVAVFELGSDGGRDFIAMEYVQGEELKYFVGITYRFTHAEIALIITEVLQALAAAHSKGVVHRDIKPANIILLDDGSVKVADFGVARLDDSDLTMAGHMVGTPSYMSPEGLRGQQVDFKADIYSTAMVLFELLTGKKPQAKMLYVEPVADFVEQVFEEHEGEPISEALKQLVRKGLSASKEDRFSSAHDFIKAIERVMGLADVDASEQTVITLADTVISQRPVKKEVEPEVIAWDEEMLQQLEKGLASYVGPLAKVFVKRDSTANSTPEQLVQTLAGHIDDADEKAAFLKKARKCITAGCSTDITASGVEATIAETLPHEKLEEISRLLASYIGPLAKRLVDMEAKKQTRLETFCEALADKIPSEVEQKKFMEAVCQ